MSEGRVATIDADGHVIALQQRGDHRLRTQDRRLRAEDWDRTIAVNLRGPFLCAKHALPHLVRRGGGVIVNVSSHGAFQASPTGIADYAVAKGGLVTLTYYLASEYGAANVRANCIAPGPVPTDLNRPFLGTPEGRAMTASFIPLGRVGEIDDVARAAMFLASDEARWITGAGLRVDGGIGVQWGARPRPASGRSCRAPQPRASAG